MKTLAQRAHRAHRPSSLIAVVILMLPFGFTGQARAEKLTIGAWNIEWLGSPDSRSGPARGIPQQPEDLAEYVQQSGVDILSLEEIDNENESGDKPLNVTLTLAFEKLNESAGQDWDYILLPKRDPAAKTQLTGVAWNRAKVELSGVVKVPHLDQPGNEFTEWDRGAHAVKLSAGPGKSDLVVIPIHMKSNRGGPAKTREQRALEASLLTSQLQFVRQQFADDDILILGDSNCLKRDEVAIQTYVGAGFKDLNSADEPTTFRGPAPFDRIFVSAGEGEFVSSGFKVFKTLSPDIHKVKLSDHYMVVTTIDVINDEDAVSGTTPGIPPTPAPGTPPVAVPTPASPPLLEGIRITKILPNPSGNEDEEESVTLRNFSADPQNLAGLKLRDKARTTWSLSGTLAPGQEKTFKRAGQEMALSNKGDVIELVEGSKVLDHVEYQNSADGVEIIFIQTGDDVEDSNDP